MYYYLQTKVWLVLVTVRPIYCDRWLSLKSPNVASQLPLWRDTKFSNPFLITVETVTLNVFSSPTTMLDRIEMCSAKIDVHHHIFLPELSKHKADQNAKVGWKTPEENMPWSIQKSLEAMEKLGIAGAVLSYPAGVPENLVASPFRHSTGDHNGSACRDGDTVTRRERNREVVRELNTHAKGLCDRHQSRGRFGWFACLPDLRNVEGEHSMI